MQVYQYQFNNLGSTNEFIVAATSAEEALKLFDISRSEFMRSCKLVDDQPGREVAMRRPNKVLYRGSHPGSNYQELEGSESILSIRLKQIFEEVKAARPASFN